MEIYKNKRLDLELSKISFGGASLSGDGGGYGFGEIGESNAQALVEMAIDAGVNIFDTAPIYGFHNSEIRLGKFIKSQREKVKIVSKSGITWHSTKRVNLTNDPKVCEQMLHTSLKNLQTEYIDFYLIHWPDKQVDIRRPLEVLAKAQDKGQIKYIGLSNTTKEDFEKAQEIAQVDLLQAESNLFNHHLKFLKDEITNKEIITMGWGTLDKGILSGKLQADQKFSKEDARSWAPWWKKSNWREKLEKAQMVEKKLGVSIKSLAMSFSQKNNSTSICGVKSPEQLFDLIAQSQNIIEEELIDEAIRLLNE